MRTHGTRFPRSARVRPRPGRALSVPRGQRCSPGHAPSAAAACRISTAGPCHPATQPSPEWNLTRHQQEFTVSHPIPVLPLTCGHHGRNGILGLFRGLRTRPSRNRPRTPERGQARTLPGAMSPHQPDLLDVLTHHGEVDPGRPAGVATGGFPRVASRTRRAPLNAPGAPQVPQDLVPISCCARPWCRDLRSPVVVAPGADSGRVEQLHGPVTGPYAVASA